MRLVNGRKYHIVHNIHSTFGSEMRSKMHAADDEGGIWTLCALMTNRHFTLKLEDLLPLDSKLSPIVGNGRDCFSSLYLH